MKKICFILIVLFASNIFAQEENQGQSIELPEFVITGQQSVDIKATKKSKPAYIGIVSENYLTPSISPEKMTMSSISDPFNFEQNLFPYPEFINGQLKIGVGINTLPIGNFKYNYVNKNVILHADVEGLNIREYEDYSDYNETGVGAGIDWFNNNDAKVLPGLRISANGNYIKNSYYFYGSLIPSYQRETENIKGKLSFSSYLKKSFSYDFSFTGNQLKFKENDMEELNGTANAFVKYANAAFDLTVSGYFQMQELKNTLLEGNYNSFGGKALTGFTLSNGIYFNVGVNYSTYDTTNFVSPIGSIRFELNPYLSFIAEYNPYTKLSTYKDILEENKFFAMNNRISNVFTEYKNSMNVAVKYQFYKYFEINGGAKYSKADNYLYFEDIKAVGIFEPITTDNVTLINLYGNFLFHKGPNGTFYGEVEYNSAKFDDKNKVPYTPELTAKISYTINLHSRLRLNVNTVYLTKTYADSNNLIEIPSNFNLGGLVGYKIFDSLELTAEVQNILNKKNYKFLNYRQKPFDVIVGINYTW